LFNIVVDNWQAPTHTINLQEGGSAQTIQLQLTVPVTCPVRNWPQSRCELYVSARMPQNTGNPQDPDSQWCRATFYPQDWKPNEGLSYGNRSSIKVHVLTTSGQGYHRNSIEFDNIMLMQTPHFRQYKAPSISVSHMYCEFLINIFNFSN
jgi:hypothetical protein